MNEFLESIPTMEQNSEEVLKERALSQFILINIVILAFYSNRIFNFFFKTKYTWKNSLLFWANTALILGCLMLIFGINTMHDFYVYKEVFNDPRFPKNQSLKIAVFGDLHLHSPVPSYFNKTFERIFNTLDKEKPDLLLITGDLITMCGNSTYDLQNHVINLFKRLNCDVYCVTGNHDFSCLKAYKYLLNNAKIHIISSDVIKLKKCSSKEKDVYLSAISPPTWDEDHFPSAISKINNNYHEDAYNILLHHYYDSSSEYATTNMFDFMIFGHSHGGQLVLPHSFWALYPAINWYENIGLKYHTSRIENSIIHISRGIGVGYFARPQIRLGITPEMSILTIQNF